MLTKCSECGHDVSTEAKKCPNCGAAIKKSQEGPILPQPKDALFIHKIILPTILQYILGLGAFFGGIYLAANDLGNGVTVTGIVGVVLAIIGLAVLVVNFKNVVYIWGYFLSTLSNGKK